MNKLNKLLLSHLAISLAYITFFVFFFSRQPSIIPLHIVVVCTLYFSVFYFSRMFKSQFKIISITLFTLMSGTLTLVYIADLLSNSLWNDNISLQFVLAFVSNLEVLLEDIPLAIPVLLAFIFSIFIFIYWTYNKFITYLHSYDEDLSFNDSKLYILTSLLACALLYINFEPTNPGIWESEPVSSLAVKTNTISHLYSDDDILDFKNSNSQTVNYNLPNIILVHADSLRADHMSSYGYSRKTTPFIDSLISQGATKIDTGLSICSESICGILSALGSKEMKDITVETPLLQTYLKDTGYRVLFSGSGKLSWENLDSIISHDIDYFERADLDEKFSINDDTKILSTLNKVINYSGIPTFFFLHYMSSHQTGRHFPQYNQYTPSDKSLLTYLFPSLDNPQVLVNAYDNHVVQMDNMLKKSINLLNNKGYIDNSIIIIYGDHGEALNEHGYYGHYKNLFQEEIHVPIIFTSNDNMKIRETQLSTLDDILPTVLDILNIAAPKDINGVSLLETHPNRTTFHNSRTGIYAIIQKENDTIFKLLFNENTNSHFLYNLENDPLEKNSLNEKLPSKADKLLSDLKIYFSLVL